MNRPLPDPRNNSMLLYCTICGMVCDHIIRDHIVHSHKEYFRACRGGGRGPLLKKKITLSGNSELISTTQKCYQRAFSSQTLEKNILGLISA